MHEDLTHLQSAGLYKRQKRVASNSNDNNNNNTDNNNNNNTNNNSILADGYFDDAGRPRVCELNAGVAVMSVTLAALGCCISMLSECALHLHAYLKAKAPDASIASDNNDKPWIQWAAIGLRALIVVAGVSCQPFSVAGKMLGGEDKRAWDALLVCEAAVALGAIYVLLENVPGYVDRDNVHGVFSEIKAAFKRAGYELVRVFYPKHSNCGGRTHRSRVLILFARRVYLPHLQLDNLKNLSFSTPPPVVPFNFQLDRTRNWLSYGWLDESKNGQLFLQYSTHAIVPGAIAVLSHNNRLWRVQSRSGDMVKLMDTERRRSTVTHRPTAQVTIQAGHKESRYPVQRAGDVYRTITAFGEPPAKGGPLILVEGAEPEEGFDERKPFWSVFSISVQDKALLNDFSMADLELMRELGLTEDQITSLVGGCVPQTMVFETLLLILQSLSSLVPSLDIAPWYIPRAAKEQQGAAPAFGSGQWTARQADQAPAGQASGVQQQFGQQAGTVADAWQGQSLGSSPNPGQQLGSGGGLGSTGWDNYKGPQPPGGMQVDRSSQPTYANTPVTVIAPGGPCTVTSPDGTPWQQSGQPQAS